VAFSIRTLSVLWAQLKSRRVWPFICFLGGGVAAIGAWLFVPAAWNPYMRIAGSQFTIVPIACAPQAVTVETTTPYAVVNLARLELQAVGESRLLAAYPLDRAAHRTEEGVSFSFTVPQPSIGQIADAVKRFEKQSKTFGAHVEFARVPSLDLTKVNITYPEASKPTCMDEELEGDALAKRLRAANVRPMRYFLIQDKLSDFVFRGNELVGNVLVSGLVLMFLWVLLSLGDAFRSIYLVSDAGLRKQMHTELRGASLSGESQALEVLQQQYSAKYQKLAFARVFAPAMGFLLTVSSLIAGLHPSTTASQDMFRFVSSLQLALVATFMGLLVRLVAELAVRYHRELAQRKADLLAK